MAGAAEAGAGDLAVDLVVLGEQDAEAAAGAEPSGDGFGVVERRGFGAEARPERREADRTEELGLAAELHFGGRHQNDLLAREGR